MLLEEARESYNEEIVMGLTSDSVEDISNNVSALIRWVNEWEPPSSV